MKTLNTRIQKFRFKTVSAWEFEVEIDEVIREIYSLSWFYCFDFESIFERHE